MLPVERLRMDIDDVVDGPLGIERFTDDFVNGKILKGVVYNDALKSDLFSDETAYLELERNSFGYKERVFVGSDGNVIGAVENANKALEFFVVKADTENQLYDYAVNIGEDLGVYFRENEAQGYAGEHIARIKKEFGHGSFESWFKEQFKEHADKFVHVDFDQFVEIYESNQFWIENAVEEVLENGLFNPSSSREELRDQIVDIVNSVKEVLDKPEAARFAEMLNYDATAMVDLDIDDVEYKIEAATVEAQEVKSDEPTIKQRNKMKP